MTKLLPPVPRSPTKCAGNCGRFCYTAYCDQCAPPLSDPAHFNRILPPYSLLENDGTQRRNGEGMHHHQPREAKR
jgi:hypothetical protein